MTLISFQKHNKQSSSHIVHNLFRHFIWHTETNSSFLFSRYQNHVQYKYKFNQNCCSVQIQILWKIVVQFKYKFYQNLLQFKYKFLTSMAHSFISREFGMRDDDFHKIYHMSKSSVRLLHRKIDLLVFLVICTSLYL